MLICPLVHRQDSHQHAGTHVCPRKAEKQKMDHSLDPSSMQNILHDTDCIKAELHLLSIIESQNSLCWKRPSRTSS